MIAMMTPATTEAAAVTIGTRRRPPKKARYVGSLVRRYFSYILAAIRPMTMPPRTP